MATPSVLHVTQPSEYGVGIYLLQIVETEVRAGWTVTVAGNPGSSLGQRTRDAGATWIDWESDRDPGAAVLGEVRRLRGIVRQVAPDVVHLHSSKAGLVGRLVVRRRIPTIFQPHAWSFFALEGHRSRLARVWERASARWADVLLCGSEAEQAAGQAAGIKARRWHVIPNAVDTDRFTPGDKREARGRLLLGAVPVLEAIGDAPLVVCVSRLAAHQKGQDVLIESWDAVVDAVPGAHLVLVGDGPDRPVLEALAMSCRRSASVWFAGGSVTTEDWFRAADVVVQPSRYETLSLSVLEALSVGRPVVVTDGVGMREAGGDDAVVVPCDDPTALASALTERLRDPPHAEVAARGRDRVIADHGLRQWGEAIVEATRDVLRSR